MRAVLASLLSALALSACTVGARSGRPMRIAEADARAAACVAAGAAALPPPPDPDRVPGTPSIRVKWEALAVERSQAEAARVRLKVRDYTGGSAFDKLAGDVDFEVVLLNTSYVATPEQAKEDRSQPPAGRTARVPDRDMVAFLLSLEQSGFFKYAQPTGSVASLFASDNARGRLTVERDGVSVTLLSMRGQGRVDATRPIVGIYSEAKQAVQVLKNRSPSLRFKSTDRDPLRRVPTTPRPAGEGAGGATGPGGAAGGATSAGGAPAGTEPAPAPAGGAPGTGGGAR